MTSQPSPSSPRDLDFWRSVTRQLRLAYRLLRDPEMPFYLKLLPVGVVVYWLFPLEGMALPFLITPLDDLGLLALGLKTFINLAPPHLVQEHLDIMDGKVIKLS